MTVAGRCVALAASLAFVGADDIRTRDLAQIDVAQGRHLRINANRLWDSLMKMAKIGPGIGGGNNRQTLTDGEARAGTDVLLHAVVETAQISR